KLAGVKINRAHENAVIRENFDILCHFSRLLHPPARGHQPRDVGQAQIGQNEVGIGQRLPLLRITYASSSSRSESCHCLSSCSNTSAFSFASSRSCSSSSSLMRSRNMSLPSGCAGGLPRKSTRSIKSAGPSFSH